MNFLLFVLEILFIVTVIALVPARRASIPQRARAEKHSAHLAVREIPTVVRHGFVK
jgi:Tfp pilus assembly protein PilX